jgi:phage repressor protein C with HTH and peptisase S24 domain
MKSTALIKMQGELSLRLKESSDQISGMENEDLAKRVGAVIRLARKQQGFVMRQVADAAGVSTQAVGNWERGANLPSMENFRSLASFFGADVDALSRGELKMLAADFVPSDAERVTDLGTIDTGPRDVPLLGMTVGGDDGDFSLNGEIAGFVRRPPGIANMRKVFALTVTSESMVPRYEPHELIYVGGNPPVAGDHIVIEMFPEKNETVGKSFIKRLDGRTKDQYLCSQYNPPKQLTFDRYAVKQIWRVIPLRELMGF